MVTRRVVGVVFLLLLTPVLAGAQTTGIAGLVKDSSGAVLPGVTVEAASPALIEKVRSVVTNEQGLYQIVDLRPGVYTVTFSLPGFATVKREGITLSGSFTATVNADLSVGALSETLTVTGASPVVDVRNTVQQTVLTEEFRESLPTSRAVQHMAALIPGMVNLGGDRPVAQDVGGLTGDRGSLRIHGSRNNDFTIQMDGMMMNHASGNGAQQSYTFNPAEAQEFVYEVGAVSAATQTGGVRANVIPKEGSNRLSGSFLTAFANNNFQSSNIDDDLRAAGLTQQASSVQRIWDNNVALGGPIAQDKVWFFGSYRYWGARDRAAGIYHMIDPQAFIYDPARGAAGNADLGQPEGEDTRSHAYGARVTWQATPRNKFSVYASTQPRVKKFNGVSNGVTSPEAATFVTAPVNRLIQASWRSPLSSRVMVEAIYALPQSRIPNFPTFNGIDSLTDSWLSQSADSYLVGVRDTGTGYTFRATPVGYRNPEFSTPSVTSTVSYVTGSHAIKTGFELVNGSAKTESRVPQGMSYTLQNGSPRSITVNMSPIFEQENFRTIGIYAQDQWTTRRLTANLGLRFDSLNESIPEQTSGPGPFSPLRTWAEVKNVPNWKDISPRLGVSYDLFGNAKTAVKATVGRYVVRDHTSFAVASNPLLFNRTATREWRDANTDYIPQESELQPLSNSAFGTGATTTRTDEAIRDGWGVRAYNWETTAGVQHELVPQISLNLTYSHRSFGNFTVVDNVALTSADYDPFCFTPPTNTKVSGVGGAQICSMYDLNPAKRSVTPDNLRTDASNYGKQRETYNGVDLTTNIHLNRYRAQFSGGIAYGMISRSSTEACFVIDSPEQMRFCDVNAPWQPSVRFGGSVGLPLDLNLGVTMSSTPGPEILADFQLTDAVVQGLGRVLTSRRTVPLIEPGTMYADRVNQLDLRLSRGFNLGNARARLNLDIANALNSNAALLLNTAYGSNWLNPAYILPGRLFKPTLQIDF